MTKANGLGVLGLEAARTPDEVRAALEAVGYVADRRVALAVRALLLARADGASAPALLLEGPPGAGKTALGEAIARALAAPLVVHQLHQWTDADDLHVGVDVAAAVEGDAGAVRQPGVLAVAAELTHRGNAVLLLDEIDKAEEEVEALLLDFLQSGRVPVQPGRHVVANLQRLLVILTSNGRRELSEALRRRCRLLRLEAPPLDLLVQLAARRSGAPQGVVRLLARALRSAVPEVSAQEVAHAAREAWEIAESSDDVREVLRAWSRGREVESPRIAEAIWGEVAAARRRGERAA